MPRRSQRADSGFTDPILLSRRIGKLSGDLKSQAQQRNPAHSKHSLVRYVPPIELRDDQDSIDGDRMRQSYAYSPPQNDRGGHPLPQLRQQQQQISVPNSSTNTATATVDTPFGVRAPRPRREPTPTPLSLSRMGHQSAASAAKNQRQQQQWQQQRMKTLRRGQLRDLLPTMPFGIGRNRRTSPSIILSDTREDVGRHLHPSQVSSRRNSAVPKSSMLSSTTSVAGLERGTLKRAGNVADAKPADVMMESLDEHERKMAQNTTAHRSAVRRVDYSQGEDDTSSDLSSATIKAGGGNGTLTEGNRGEEPISSHPTDLTLSSPTSMSHYSAAYRALTSIRNEEGVGNDDLTYDEEASEAKVVEGEEGKVGNLRVGWSCQDGWSSYSLFEHDIESTDQMGDISYDSEEMSWSQGTYESSIIDGGDNYADLSKQQSATTSCRTGATSFASSGGGTLSSVGTPVLCKSGRFPARNQRYSRRKQHRRGTDTGPGDISATISEQSDELEHYIKMSDGDDYYKTKQDHGNLSIILVMVQFLLMCAEIVGCGVAPVYINPTIGPYPNVLSDWGGKNVSLLLYQGQWYRLLTPAFLNVGLVHLLINAYVMLETSAFFERSWGSLRWFVIYIGSTLGSNLLASILSPATISVGSTAALMGIIGARFAEVVTLTIFDSIQKYGVADTEPTATGLPLSSSPAGQNNMLFGTVWSLLALSLVTLAPHVDGVANLGGFLTGFLLGGVIFGKYIGSWWKRALFRIGILSLLALGIGLAVRELLTQVHPKQELEDSCQYFSDVYDDGGYDCTCRWTASGAWNAAKSYYQGYVGGGNEGDDVYAINYNADDDNDEMENEGDGAEGQDQIEDGDEEDQDDEEGEESDDGRRMLRVVVLSMLRRRIKAGSGVL